MMAMLSSDVVFHSTVITVATDARGSIQEDGGAADRWCWTHTSTKAEAFMFYGHAPTSFHFCRVCLPQKHGPPPPCVRHQHCARHLQRHQQPLCQRVWRTVECRHGHGVVALLTP